MCFLGHFLELSPILLKCNVIQIIGVILSTFTYNFCNIFLQSAHVNYCNHFVDYVFLYFALDTDSYNCTNVKTLNLVLQ